ncbi:MDL2 [Candida pseudojiufengensis]|uniref:MDL2 n=1 Tax=Candida pseudojiufengensis TaxID=497109 RepID=UPI002224E4E5|nr:MDL2 [Candida pseudojiufengensis]KAI5965361.1 MDL2 [Candida pseudojiufengensis]
MSSIDLFYADTEAPIVLLSASKHFNQLSSTNLKKYAHYLSRASYNGSKAILDSVSKESPEIFELIMLIHEKLEKPKTNQEYLDKIKSKSIDDQDLIYYLEYACQFLDNMGNYKSFGDRKFIPRISKEKFRTFVDSLSSDKISKLYFKIEDSIYDTSKGLLGFPENGFSTNYYPNSENITKDEIQIVDNVLASNEIMPENTRIIKNDNGSFTVLISSADSKNIYEHLNLKTPQGQPINFQFGDHSKQFSKIVENLTKALPYTSNSTQQKLIELYIESFKTGSMKAHKLSQIEWIKDFKPEVESNIGFIETYRDPAGVRGEWEGLVAMVNHERTKNLTKLVEKANNFIIQLPWDSIYGKTENFSPPDFTSLEVLTFSGSGVPAGINIPNYDDVRLNYGFKNVSLGNVLTANPKNPKKEEIITFLDEKDKLKFKKWRDYSFEVQVAAHELIGHGLNKLFKEIEPGKFNFDKSDSRIKSWYKQNQTWSSLFGEYAGSYEECRAELIALFLIIKDPVNLLPIFDITKEQDQKDVVYIATLSMIRAGLIGLEFWDPQAKKWGQAHMQGRFAIMKQLHKFGVFDFEYTESNYSDLKIKINESKLYDGTAIQALSEFLSDLHIFKVSANKQEGLKFYLEKSNVDEEYGKFRDIVLKEKRPRKKLIQANTFLKDDDSIELIEYDESEAEIAKLKKREIKQEEKEQISKQDNKKFKDNLKTILRILKLGKSDWKLFLLAIGFILCAVLYPTTAVKLVGALLDSFSNGNINSDGQLMVWGYPSSTIFAVMVPFMCLSAVCFWARIWVLKLLGERLVARLRSKVMKNLLRHDSKFYDNDKNKVGDLISRLSSDAYVVSKSITSNLPDGLKNLLFGIISSYMMYSINPMLFGIMLLISPPITIGSVWYGEKIRKLSTKLQNATAGLTKVSEETLNSVKLVNSFTGEQKEMMKYSDKLRQVVKVAKEEALAQSNYSVSIYTLYHAGYLSCVAIGIWLMMKHQMTAGDVVAFTMYSEFFNSALYSLTTTYLELMKGAGAGVRLFDLIDYKNDVNPILGDHKNQKSLLKNEVEFKNVTFSYPTRPNDKIFNDCSFIIRPSSSTCIVAPSGAGKSTVASLLLRSYNIQSGEILIGGKNIADIQPRELRRHIIGIVQQEPVLLSGSILENIVYGLTSKQIKNLTMDDIIEVCKQANCYDFIESFPDKYDTIIGSRGASISGGQKQRIAIARALIKKPSILILDEATSALDSFSESLINETLKDLTTQGKMTIISIAHRLSTISKSEFIVVLGKNGKVVEQGKFIDLFSDPQSELSKLLDESITKQEEEKINEDEIESIDQENYKASQIEKNQKDFKEFELQNLQDLQSLFNNLPENFRDKLIEEITLDTKKKIENFELTMNENFKR